MPAENHLRYILFDLDNTLYDQTSGLLQRIDRRIDEYLRERCALVGADIHDMRVGYWQRYGTTLEGLLAEHPGTNAKGYLDFIQDVPVEEMLGTDPRLGETLSRIETPKAVFTNSSEDYARRVLNALGVIGHFTHVSGLDTRGCVSKPNLRAYHDILGMLGVQASECLFVEDTVGNLQVAKSLGMRTVLISAEENAEVDYVIPTVYLLDEALRKMRP